MREERDTECSLRRAEKDPYTGCEGRSAPLIASSISVRPFGKTKVTVFPASTFIRVAPAVAPEPLTISADLISLLDRTSDSVVFRNSPLRQAVTTLASRMATKQSVRMSGRMIMDGKAKKQLSPDEMCDRKTSATGL